ncbi:hypothetical protein MRX96_042061 [Rhipicephalus microplus]
MKTDKMTSTSSDWEPPAVVKTEGRDCLNIIWLGVTSRAVVKTEDEIGSTSSGLEPPVVMKTDKITSISPDWEKPVMVKTEYKIAFDLIWFGTTGRGENKHDGIDLV